MNAMSIGRDPAHASIAVTRGLLDTLDREELQGVVAHELAHIANFDSRHALLVALLVGAVVVMTELFLHLMVEIATNPWVGGDSISGMAGSLAVWLVVTVVGLVFALTLRLFAPLAALAVQAAVSRDREYLADATAVGITRNPAGLIAALGDLDHANAAVPDASGGTQHLWIVNPVRESGEGGRGWFATHPATSDRIDAPALARRPRAAARICGCRARLSVGSARDLGRLRPDHLPAAVPSLVQVGVPEPATRRLRPVDRERHLRAIPDHRRVAVTPDLDLPGLPQRVGDVAGPHGLEVPGLREHPPGRGDQLEVIGMQVGRPVEVDLDQRPEPLPLDRRDVVVGRHSGVPADFFFGARSSCPAWSGHS